MGNVVSVQVQVVYDTICTVCPLQVVLYHNQYPTSSSQTWSNNVNMCPVIASLNSFCVAALDLDKTGCVVSV